MGVFDNWAKGGPARRRARALATMVLIVCASGVPVRRPLAAEARAQRLSPDAPTIRVDRHSFWYERLPRWNEREPWEVQAVPPGSSARLMRLLQEVLARHPGEFPQPPPLEVVVQAPPREQLDTLLGYMANRTSYGGARRTGRTVYIDVNQSVFVGPDRLNDAELRAFLGHELVHAYQFAHGRAKLGHREIFRREVAAYTWELTHLDPGVRSPYRGEILINLHMYGEMLGR